VGEHEFTDPRLRRVLGRLPGGKVPVRRVAGLVEERSLAQQQVGIPRQRHQSAGFPGIGRVGERPAVMLDPEPERFDRVVHVSGGDSERPDPGRPRVEPPEAEPVAQLVGHQAEHRRQPLRGPPRPVHRDGRQVPGRPVMPRHGVRTQVNAMVPVQVTQADRVDFADPRVPLQRPERTVPEVNDQPEPFRLNQVTRSGTLRAGKAPRAPDHRNPHNPHYS
jgi:hypothetical protein